MLLWQRSIVEMDHGLFWYFGPYFIEKSHGTYEIRILFDFGHLSDTPTSRDTFGEEWTKAKIVRFSQINSIFDLAGWGEFLHRIDPTLLANLLLLCQTIIICSIIGTFFNFRKCIPPLPAGLYIQHTHSECHDATIRWMLDFTVAGNGHFPYLRCFSQ